MNKYLLLTSFCTCLRSKSSKQDCLVDPARWIGRRGPVACHPCSPDRNPLHFFFWGHMKSLVYETPVDSAEELVARIVVTADEINTTPGIFERVRQSFLRRCELCNDFATTLSTCCKFFSDQ
ncbi:hypothetical protein AVEN_124771-1 [Araneus ventricosus]|uniref:Uncharacterized protein n=1 Tax=Araneus ventricosus TaxID=182803 RepID=A0A4Y2KJR8_ARAVE|nr:hypothetical protein AVEN_124771-1 [Araneus ventricosus]